jgi:hypothetical protein
MSCASLLGMIQAAFCIRMRLTNYEKDKRICSFLACRLTTSRHHQMAMLQQKDFDS